MKDELNVVELACLAYGQVWGVFKTLRALGDRVRAREMLPTMRRARELCMRRCYKCQHYIAGRCMLLGIKGCRASEAVGCGHYLPRNERRSDG